MPRVIPETWIITVSIPANQPANSFLVANINRDPLVGAKPEVQLNIKESVVFDDIFIKASTDVGIDGILILEVDGVEEFRTPPVSTLLISNPQRPRPLQKKKVVVGKAGRITAKYINLAAGGSTATTTTVYLDVVAFKE